MQSSVYFDTPFQREDKPPFAAVPPAMIDAIGAHLGSAVTAGHVIYGGYSPAAGFGLQLADGRRIFAKGSHPGEMSHATQNLRDEARVYETVKRLAAISPLFYGVVSDGDEDGWMLGLWDYISPRARPPRGAEAVDLLLKMQTGIEPQLVTAENHNYLGHVLSPDKKWQRIADESATRDKFLSLFANPAAGAAWLSASLRSLVTLQQKILQLSGPRGLIHGDLRLDNMIFAADGRGFVVDWPNAAAGPRGFDLVFLAAHIASCGLMSFWAAVDHHTQFSVLPVPHDDCVVLAATLAGFFADQAYRAVPPRLPRLRWMQKNMLLSLLVALAEDGVIASPPRFEGQLY